MTYRAPITEEGVKECGYTVVEYLIDTLHIDPSKIVLYYINWMCNVGLVIHLVLQLLFIWQHTYMKFVVYLLQVLFFKYCSLICNSICRVVLCLFIE